MVWEETIIFLDSGAKMVGRDGWVHGNGLQQGTPAQGLQREAAQPASNAPLHTSSSFPCALGVAPLFGVQVFLSATLSNSSQFAAWVAHLHTSPCHVVYTDFRPTPLQVRLCVR